MFFYEYSKLAKSIIALIKYNNGYKLSIPEIVDIVYLKTYNAGL